MHDLVCIALFHESVEYRVGFGMRPQHSCTMRKLSHVLMSPLSKKQLDLFMQQLLLF